MYQQYKEVQTLISKLDRKNMWVFVNRVLNQWIPKNEGKFLTTEYLLAHHKLLCCTDSVVS